MAIFNVGDKVYFPKRSTRVLTIDQNPDLDSDLPLRVSVNTVYYYFTKDGFGLDDDGKFNQMLWFATAEDKQYLEQEHEGLVLDQPPATPFGSIVARMLQGGVAFVPCYTTNSSFYPGHTDEVVLISQITKDGAVCNGKVYQFVTPFSITEGRIIVDYRNGSPVFE